jgi:hypothetical protein
MAAMRDRPLATGLRAFCETTKSRKNDGSEKCTRDEILELQQVPECILNARNWLRCIGDTIERKVNTQSVRF